MQEEIFRFSIARNPRRYTAQQLQYSVIELVSEPFDRLPFFQTLRRFRESNQDRSRYISFAKASFQGDAFLRRLSDLETPIGDTLDWMRVRQGLTAHALEEAITQIFGLSVKLLVEQPEFLSDRHRIIDSLVLAAITAPPQPGLRGQLMDARRLVHLLEELAHSDEELSSSAIKRVMHATVLLPTSIFPLPSNNEERSKQNQEAFEQRERLIKEKEARIQERLDRLDANNAAIKELAQSHSRFLLDQRHLSNADNGESVSLSVLPSERLNELSLGSREVIATELKVGDEVADVPYIVKKLETLNLELSDANNQELANDNFTASPDIVFRVTCGECQPAQITISKAENDFAPDTRGKSKPTPCKNY